MSPPPNAPGRSRWVARVLLAFAAAVLATYLLASVLQTAFVLLGLRDAGARFSPGVVLTTVLHDLHGLAFNALFVSYPLLIAAGLAVAFPVAALLRRWTGAGRRLLYPLAGAAMMGAMLALSRVVFYGITLYAGSRGAWGLAGQMLAGALGGLAFALVLEAAIPHRPPAEESSP